MQHSFPLFCSYRKFSSMTLGFQRYFQLCTRSTLHPYGIFLDTIIPVSTPRNICHLFSEAELILNNKIIVVVNKIIFFIIILSILSYCFYRAYPNVASTENAFIGIYIRCYIYFYSTCWTFICTTATAYT